MVFCLQVPCFHKPAAGHALEWSGHNTSSRTACQHCCTGLPPLVVSTRLCPYKSHKILRFVCKDALTAATEWQCNTPLKVTSVQTWVVLPWLVSPHSMTMSLHSTAPKRSQMSLHSALRTDPRCHGLHPQSRQRQQRMGLYSHECAGETLTWVVLPQPVSPHSMMTSLYSTASTTSCSIPVMGSLLRASSMSGRLTTRTTLTGPGACTPACPGAGASAKAIVPAAGKERLP